MPTRSLPVLRCLILEDNSGDAELIAYALRPVVSPGWVQTVRSAVALRRALEEFRPDVVLSDHGLPGCSSLDALRLTQEYCPGVPFILVAGALEPDAVLALKSGAADFVSKAELHRLPSAISLALKHRAPLRSLSGRQLEVLRLLASGQTMLEIAKELQLSIKTVESHRSELMRRLSVRDLTNLVRLAIRLGVVSAEP